MPNLLRLKKASWQLVVPSPISSRLHFRRSHGTAQALDQSLPVDSLNHSQPMVNDYNPPLKLRKHGFKSLPLSPLMRTEKDAPATTRRAQPLVDDALKQLQKEVATNPFAQALATPVRYCSLTLAHLPSYYLLPFTTLVEQNNAPSPSNDASTPPQIKVSLQPGLSSDHPSQQTLAQTSYIINRQDAVRHLSRKRHWAFLVSERQRARVASLARRSASSPKLVHDLWVWENQVDGMAAYLEKQVVEEVVKRASKIAAAVERDTASSFSREQVAELRFVRVDSGDVAATRFSPPPGEANTTTTTTIYELTTLLSPEALESTKSYVSAQDVKEGVWEVKDSHAAWRIRLALEKLKSYKESNEIQKALPMVQNPTGSREARLQRSSELGRTRSEEEGKES